MPTLMPERHRGQQVHAVLGDEGIAPGPLVLFTVALGTGLEWCPSAEESNRRAGVDVEHAGAKRAPKLATRARKAPPALWSAASAERLAALAERLAGGSVGLRWWGELQAPGTVRRGCSEATKLSRATGWP